LRVDLGDHAVDHLLVGLLVLARGGQELRDEGLHALLRNLIALVGGLELRLDHDFVEERAACRRRCPRFRLLFRLGHGTISLYFCCKTYFFSSPPAPPSSDMSFSRAAGSDTSDCTFLRNSGRLPRGPFRAVSASRRSSIRASWGTCLATASGSMSFRLESF